MERSPWTILGHLSSTLHSQFFYYLLKLAELQWLGNSYFIKISFSIQKNQKQALCIERKKLLLAKSYPGKLNQSDKHSPKDTFCTFTPVERSLRQLWKLFRHLPVRTQQFRNTITSMTKYLFKISNNNTSKKPLTAQINCSKSTIKTQNQDVKSIPSLLRYGVFIVNFEYISCVTVLSLLLTLRFC